MRYDYFILETSKKIKRPLNILGLPQRYKNITDQQEFEHIDHAVVAYFSGEQQEEASAVLETPAYLLNDELKQIFSLYMPSFQAKAIQLFAVEMDRHDNYMYWLPYFESASCLHKATEKYPNGMLKKIMLDATKIPPIPFFRLDDILEFKVVVALPLAESILRRCPYAISLTPLEVR